MVKYLVKLGFNVDSYGQSDTRRRALHIASERGDWELVTVLLENGAHLASTMEKSHGVFHVPFTLAVERGHVDLAVQKLLPNDINSSTDELLGIDF